MAEHIRNHLLDDQPAPGPVRLRTTKSRHLADHLLIAYQKACDEKDYEIAEILLPMAMMVASRARFERNQEMLLRRLAHLRQSEAGRPL